MRTNLFALFASLSLLASAGCARQPGKPASATAASGAAAACHSHAFDASAVERQAGPATLLVSTGNGFGSGFLIRDGHEELVVTNFHVIASGSEYAGHSTLADGTQRHVGLEVVSIDRDHDLALLRPLTPLQSATLVLNERRPSIGESVAVVGYPGVHGSSPVLTFEPGTITSSQRQMNSDDFIQTNANINPGNSGGPLVDACGHVVGVVAAKHKITERLGLVIPTGQLKQLLQRYHAPRVTPEQAAEKQLQAFFTEVKFRRSDKAAEYFTRKFIEKDALNALTTISRQANQKLGAIVEDLRKHHKDPQKMAALELEKLIDAQLTGEEKLATKLTQTIQKQEQSSYAAAQQYLSRIAADVFGNIDDVWVENTTLTKSGCIDAYVTASNSQGMHRYVVHLHNQWSEWLVDSITQVR